MEPSGIEPDVKPVRSKDTVDKVKALTNSVATALKDHDNDYAKSLVQESNQHCQELMEERGLTVSTKPCRLTLANEGLQDHVAAMVRGLRQDGLLLDVNKNVVDTTSELPRPNALTGLAKAIETVKKALKDGDHTLYRGNVFSRAEGSEFTYSHLDTVEDYVNSLLGFPHLSQHILNHKTRLIDILAHKSCTIIDQMRIDYDLIEVNNSMTWKFSERRFVECPLDESQRGVVSPRAFFNYDPNCTPQPKYFQHSILNSFPDPRARARFLNKWLQLFLHGRMVHKVRKLMVCGPKDSGKSTWIEPVKGVIPEGCYASITKEGKFSTSMITDETQLTFVDEFEDCLMDTSTAKRLLEGGLFANTQKFKTARFFRNTSPFYFTCQNEPNFGDDDVNVKRRLYIVKSRSLQSTLLGVDEWLRANAMHCIVWAANHVNWNLQYVEPEERFYEPGRLGTCNAPDVYHVSRKEKHYARIVENSSFPTLVRMRPLFRSEPPQEQESVPSEPRQGQESGPTSMLSTPIPSTILSPPASIPPTSPESQFNFTPMPTMITPPRTGKFTMAFSPVSAVCTPPQMPSPVPTQSSPVESIPQSDDEAVIEMSAFEPLVTSTPATPATPSQACIPQSPCLATFSDTPPVLTKMDETAKLCTAIFQLLASNIDGQADKVHFFAHKQHFSRLRSKTDAYFYAWCYVTGKFKGKLRQETLYHYFPKEDVDSHVDRIKDLVNIRTTKDDL